jgi:hypothetical protein
MKKRKILSIFTFSPFGGLRGRLFIISLMFFASQNFAQELNCNVSVISPKNQNVSPTIFRNLENAIMEFMNGRKWSNQTYKPFEKIKCNITINIAEITGSANYRATAIIQSQRPVYNSIYNSMLLTYQDQDFNFIYEDLQILDYNDNTYSSQLTSLLAFYANIFLAYDGESMAENGGEEFFQKAMTIANNVPVNERSAYKGWSRLDGIRNRFALVDGWLNSRYKDFRKAFFTYHFNGLDKMYDDATAGRSAITSSLSLFQKINKDNPVLMPLRLFAETKREELRNIYSKADMAEVNTVVPILISLDPTQTENYKRLQK